MSFKRVIGQSFRDYSNNFKVLSVIVLLLVIIPLILSIGIQAMTAPNELYTRQAQINTRITEMNITNFQNATSEQQQELLNLNKESLEILLKLIPYLILVFALSILVSFSSFFTTVSIIGVSSKQKFSFREAILSGKKNFWKSFALMLMEGIFISIGLVIIALIAIIISLIDHSKISLIIWIIVSICFLVWVSVPIMFSLFILILEDKPIWQSFTSSFSFIRGIWWKAFWNLFLFGVCIAIIYGIIFLLIYINPNSLIYGIFIALVLIVGYIVLFPMMALFMKNLYFELKRK